MEHKNELEGPARLNMKILAFFEIRRDDQREIQQSLLQILDQHARIPRLYLHLNPRVSLLKLPENCRQKIAGRASPDANQTAFEPFPLLQSGKRRIILRENLFQVRQQDGTGLRQFDLLANPSIKHHPKSSSTRLNF